MAIRKLNEGGIDTQGVFKDKNYITVIVHRVLSGKYQLLMMQRQPKGSIRGRLERDFTHYSKNAFKDVDA
ncbi:MAG: hypothetical protein QW837_08895, partial [Conexivisphaerales archaeon]